MGLDRYFGNVCELDIIFNFHKAYYILDEIFVGSELCESSKKEVLSVCAQITILQRPAVLGVYWAYVFPNAALASLSIKIAQQRQTAISEGVAAISAIAAILACVLVIVRMS